MLVVAVPTLRVYAALVVPQVLGKPIAEVSWVEPMILTIVGGRAGLTSRPTAPARAGCNNHPHTEQEYTMPEPSGKSPSLPPRWFVRSFWVVQRAVLAVTGGRFGLRTATADRWGMMRLRTVGRRTGEERRAILGYFEDGPDLVTMAMNGWADAEPAWWLNLQAHPDATVDLPGGSRAVRARAANQEERPRLWARWAHYDKELEAFAARRSRETAVVILSPQPGNPA